jgi:uroporphyrinogen-III synthase
MSEQQIQSATQVEITPSALPLQGKRVLVTRTREQASVLSERLRSLGATPIEFPTIRIVPPEDWTQLDAALRRLYEQREDKYDLLVFTSANGVNICLRRVIELGYDPASLEGVRIATIGPATAAALEAYGLHTDLLPDEYVAEGVVGAILRDAEVRKVPIAGQRILLARAAEARKILFTELQQAGALVDEVPAYYTHTVTGNDEHGRAILQMLRDHQLDILTFASSSTVKNFVSWLKSCAPDDPEPLLELVRQYSLVACIGPITAQTARELGLDVDVEPNEYTIDGLLHAIIVRETSQSLSKSKDK